MGATALAATLVNKNLRSPETNQGAPSMSKSMETKTAAMYLRKSTEDGGKSVVEVSRCCRHEQCAMWSST